MIEEHESFDCSIYIDSCGTHSYHIGQSPDVRAQHAAVNRGIDISKQMARQIEADDFDFFDYILVKAKATKCIGDILVYMPIG